jgi:hypothetical protein
MAFEELWQNQTWRKAFQRWWDEDWSWKGLKSRRQQSSLDPFDDALNGTLQDVWSNERDHLIKFGGRRWTRFHLPPFGRDGTPCPPGLWAAVKDGACSAELIERLELGTIPDKEALKRKKLRAVKGFVDLRGVVFPPTFGWRGDTLIAALDSAIFLGDFGCSKRVIATFEYAIFSGNAWFIGATFSGNAGFDGVIFSGNACFIDATFSENAVFDGATFSGNAGFNGATISGNAWFHGANFSEDAGFDDASFSGDAEFYSTTFSGNAVFDGATFSGNALFDGATISGTAWFDSATFSEEVRFDGAIFTKGVTFSGTDPFKKKVSFGATKFGQGCDFSNRTFQGCVDFSGVKFGGVPKFDGAKLHPDTSFLNAQFRDGRKGRDLPRRRHQWFGGWPPSDEKEKQDYGALRKAWKRRLRLYRYAKKTPFGLRWPGLQDVRHLHDSDTEQYETAYRCLRRLAGDIGSIEYVGLFHGLELRAHRARTDTQLLARLASWLYEKTSNYGQSLGRPLLFLLGSWGVFCALYAGWLRLVFGDALGTTCKWFGPPGSQTVPAPDLQDLVTTTARNFLSGFFGQSSLANRPAWLRCAEAYNEFGYFVVTLAQSVVFIASVTLFLIALRRRFQLRN